MNDTEKSDNDIVLEKPANKIGLKCSAAELAEERELAEGNSHQQTSQGTQGPERLQQALERIRQSVKRKEKQRMTNLWHHAYDVDRLREAYYQNSVIHPKSTIFEPNFNSRWIGKFNDQSALRAVGKF